jgi:hypothetical protein
MSVLSKWYHKIQEYFSKHPVSTDDMLKWAQMAIKGIMKYQQYESMTDDQKRAAAVDGLKTLLSGEGLTVSDSMMNWLVETALQLMKSNAAVTAAAPVSDTETK